MTLKFRNIFLHGRLKGQTCKEVDKASKVENRFSYKWNKLNSDMPTLTR